MGTLILSFLFYCDVVGCVGSLFRASFSVADPGFEDRGGPLFYELELHPPPLRGFPEATIKVYTWIF